MKPGEYFLDDASIELNAGRATATVSVNNTGDRPIQIGSHFHFFEVNRALVFDRAAAYGMRLDLPSGTGVRFEPGDVKTVQLVALGGERRVYGGNNLIMGDLDDAGVRKKAMQRLHAGGFGDTAPAPAESEAVEADKKDKIKKEKKAKRKK
jgi:urease subunit beta